MKLAFVTSYDARDVANWSGLGHHIAQALEAEGVDLDYVGPLQDEVGPMAVMKRAAYRLVGKRYLRDRDPGLVAGYARQAERALPSLSPDVVFSPGTLPVAKLKTDRPIALWTDATFAGIVRFYPGYRDLSAESVRVGNALEAEALARASLLVYSSEWAAESAVRDYGVDRRKVRVVPFGANVRGDRSKEDVQALVAARNPARLQLLFLGVDWERKGGDIALETVRQLNGMGMAADLVVVGCRPPEGLELPDYVRVEGRISKATPEGRDRLERLIAEAHFLLLPTRADCTPVVFGEANAFGVPCVAPDVGGIASILRSGLNGYVVGPAAPAEEYARVLARAWEERSGYRGLALSAFEEYRTRLNWQTAGKTVRGYLEALV